LVVRFRNKSAKDVEIWWWKVWSGESSRGVHFTFLSRQGDDPVVRRRTRRTRRTTTTRKKRRKLRDSCGLG